MSRFIFDLGGLRCESCGRTLRDVTTFFFAPAGLHPLAIVRIGVGLVLGYNAARHWPYAVELYSSTGPAAPLFAAQGFHAAVPGPGAAVVLQTLLVFFLVAVAAGWQSRTSAWGALVLAAWLWPLDHLGTFAKHVLLGMHLLFLLAWSDSGRAWSIDAWLSRRSDAPACFVRPVWPQRLMQILVCLLYFGAAVTKLKSPSFVQGDVLAFSLLDDHWGGGRFGMWLSSLPHVPMLLSLGTVIYELLFPCLVWVPSLRRAMLAAGVIVHVVMGAAMHLGIFSPMMLVALSAFLVERDLAWIAGWGVRARTQPRFAGQSWLLYFVVAVLAVGGGSAWQVSTDTYGVFGHRPLENFEELPAADVRDMLAAQLPPYEDYTHRIRLGSRLGNQQVFGSEHAFHTGGRVYVHAKFILPHPAFQLEGLLIGPDGQELTRFEQRVDASQMDAINGFELTGELRPGSYQIILQADGYEIARRRIELSPFAPRKNALSQSERRHSST